MLYSRCPVCGSKHNIVKVVSWPLPQDEADMGGIRGSYKLCGIDSDGNSCCSYDDYRFKTRKEADAVAATWGKRQLEQLNQECQDEALACTDEHGYFMDYGPCDSDPYDY
jgi:hypothetical protein